MRYALGVDVGGTNIRMAVVQEDGTIVKVIKKRTIQTKTAKGLVDQIEQLYQEINAKDYNVVGMGIGVPGPVRSSDGYVYVLSNLGIYDFNLKTLCEERLNIKTTIANDANVAAYAEATVGEGKDYNVVQYLTISTGIGGGLVINKEMITGRHGFAQEVGNMIVDQHSNKKQNDVMARGNLESLCSGTGLVFSAKEVNLNVSHAGEFFALVKEKNEKAVIIYQEWIRNLGIALANMVDYLEPDIFILGGGVMLSKDYFLEDLKKEIDKNIFAQLRGKVIIKAAKFDQDAGIIGSALIAFKN